MFVWFLIEILLGVVISMELRVLSMVIVVGLSEVLLVVKNVLVLISLIVSFCLLIVKVMLVLSLLLVSIWCRCLCRVESLVNLVCVVVRLRLVKFLFLLLMSFGGMMILVVVLMLLEGFWLKLVVSEVLRVLNFFWLIVDMVNSMMNMYISMVIMLRYDVI